MNYRPYADDASFQKDCIQDLINIKYKELECLESDRQMALLNLQADFESAKNDLLMEIHKLKTEAENL